MWIIPQGCSFISKLIDLSKTAEKLHNSIKLDSGCKSELHFWFLLCEGWNGISFFYNDLVETSIDLSFFFTDAAPLLDWVFFNIHWYPVIVACILWGNQWSRKQILVYCDNAATVNIINIGRSLVPFINTFLRRLMWTCITGNFTLHAAYIPGLDNKIADCLSRFKF